MWALSLFAAALAENVAVVGSGIGGTAAAYFLTTLGHNVTLIEREAHVGGRIGEYMVGSELVETGAAAIHSSNQYMLHFMDLLGLHESEDEFTPTSDELLGIWSGKKFKNMFLDTYLPVQLLKAYGLSAMRIKGVVKETLDKWTHIYDLLNSGESFRTPKELFTALGVYDLTQKSSYDYLRSKGLSKHLIEEFVGSASLVNYGQNSSINAFVDLVSLAGAGVVGDTTAVDGGNRQVPEGLSSKVHRVLINTSCSSIKQLGNGYRLALDMDGGSRSFDFDGVVLAAPAQSTQLPVSVPLLKYKSTHVTFVIGLLNQSLFHHTPETIVYLPITGSNAFRSISMHGRDQNSRLPIYKVFSDTLFDSDRIDAVFEKHVLVKRFHYNAYPILDPIRDPPPFELAHGLVYVNAMESVVSCMETEAVSGRNAASLLHRHLTGVVR